MIITQRLHILNQTRIKRLRLFTELRFHCLRQLANRLDTINLSPKKAAVFIQINITDPRSMKHRLGNLIIDAPMRRTAGRRYCPG